MNSTAPELSRHIDALRERLVATTTFCEIFAYFDAHVATNADLFGHSDVADHERLRAAIEACAQGVHPTFELTDVAMHEVRGTGFWHGIGQGGRHQVYFFYFDAIAMGLAALFDPLDPRGLAHYLRFSMVDPVGITMPGRVVRGLA